MQDVVATIQNLTLVPGTKDAPEGLAKLHKYLSDGGTVKAMKKTPQQIDQVVDGMLALPTHTLGIIHLLNAKVSFEVKNQNELLEQLRRVLLHGDIEQIAYAPALFANLARKFTDAVILTEKFVRGVQPLQQGIQKLQGTNAHLLTSIHSHFALVCLKAKLYSSALPILDTPLFEISKAQGIEPIEYLQYFYYGGMLYAGVKKFAKALEFFQLCLTAPSKALSAIQVEAYKKYVCVSLIETGEVAPLPAKLTSPAVTRSVVRLAGHYEAFARAYKNAGGSQDLMGKAFAEHAEAFRKDKNFGLMVQAMQAAVRRNITRLTSTYVTLSLADIAQTANVKTNKEAEKFLVGMIEDGVLFAQINQKDGMVIFHEQPDEYNSALMIRNLDSKIQEVITLSDKLKAKEKAIVTNVKYIVKTTPGLTAGLTAATGGGGAPGMGAAMGMQMGMGMGGGGGYGSYHDDEDTQMRMAMQESRAMQG